MPLLAILVIPLSICNAWIDIISAIKRCKSMAVNPVLGVAILHVGFALDSVIASVTLGVIPVNIYFLTKSTTCEIPTQKKVNII